MTSRQTIGRLGICTMMCLLIVIAGISPHLFTLTLIKQSETQAKNVLLFSGQPLRHFFIFRNPLPEIITIADSDIRKSCGCTVVDPSSRALHPGQVVRVGISINSTGKEGHVSQKAVLRWRATSGATFAMICILSATVKPALSIEPSTISFSHTEVERRQSKDIRIISHAPIDWNTLRVNPSSDYVEVAVQKVDQRTAVGKLRLSLPADSEGLSATVRVSVRATPKGPDREHFDTTSIATVTAEHSAGQLWGPRVLRFTPDTKADRLIAKMWLSTKAHSHTGNPIRSVRSDVSDVDYNIRATSSDSYFVDLYIFNPNISRYPSGFILITLIDDSIVRVPFVSVGM